MGIDDIDVMPAAAAVGARLREKREAAGLTAREVAERLRLSTNQVTALESGHTQELPPAAYVRGYVRSYAQLLGLNPDDFVYIAYDPPSTAARSRDSVPMGGQSTYLGPAVYVVLVIVAVLAGLWWHGMSAHPTNARSVQTKTKGVARVRNAHAGLPPRLQSVAAPGATVGQLSRFPLKKRAPKSTHATLKTPAAKPVAKGAVPGPAGLVSLTTNQSRATLAISATSADCWLMVYDANGRRLAYELLRQGQTVRMNGKPPFRMSFGNPSGVVVDLNGRAVSLPLARSGQVLHVDVSTQGHARGAGVTVRRYVPRRAVVEHRKAAPVKARPAQGVTMQPAGTVAASTKAGPAHKTKTAPAKVTKTVEAAKLPSAKGTKGHAAKGQPVKSGAKRTKAVAAVGTNGKGHQKSASPGQSGVSSNEAIMPPQNGVKTMPAGSLGSQSG